MKTQLLANKLYFFVIHLEMNVAWHDASIHADGVRFVRFDRRVGIPPTIVVEIYAILSGNREREVDLRIAPAVRVVLRHVARQRMAVRQIIL